MDLDQDFENEHEEFATGTISGKRDIGSGHIGGSSEKRRKTDFGSIDGNDFYSLLQEAGCDLKHCDQNSYQVEDPRRLCRVLEQKLTLNDSLRKTFFDGLQSHLEEMEALHAALKPMEVLDPAVPITGESFIHALLSVSVIQRELSQHLLHRLCEFCNEQPATETGVNNDKTSISQLILGQFRWLHAPLDGRFLTSKLLEVLPAIPEDAQHDALALLEEIAEDDDFDQVLEAITDLISNLELLVPGFKALYNMAQDDDQRMEVVKMVTNQFSTARDEDVPAVVGFLLRAAGCNSAIAAECLTTLRQGLYFVQLDPRKSAPNLKGKSRIPNPDEHPELLIVESMRQALQLSASAADAAMKSLEKLTKPDEHTTFDFWLLVVVASLSADRAKAVEALIAKKLKDHQVEERWLVSGITRHQHALKPLFQQLLALSQRLIRAPQDVVSSGGATLYRLVYLEFPDAYHRQETLRTLHSHLGSHVPQEIALALTVLRDIAVANPDALMAHATFVAAVLDHVDTYAQPQAAAAFEAFAELVAGVCECRDGVFIRGHLPAENGITGGEEENDEEFTQGGRSRFEDELFVFLTKQLGSTLAAHRRVGVMGAVALVKRLGSGAGCIEDENTAVGQKYKEAIALLDNAISGYKRAPDTFAMFCDEMARVTAAGMLHKKLVQQLLDKMQSILEAELEELGGSNNNGHTSEQAMQRKIPIPEDVLWDINGASSIDIAVRALQQPSTSRTTMQSVATTTNGLGTHTSHTLLSVVRLVLLLQWHSTQDFAGVDAVLGIGIILCSDENLTRQGFARLKPEEKSQVLLALFYAANWCRELINGFSLALTQPGSEETEAKLLARLRALCQFEAVLRALMVDAPSGFVLPCLEGVAPTPTSAAGNSKAAGKQGAAGKRARTSKKKDATTNAGDDSNMAGSDDHNPEGTKTTKTSNDDDPGATTNAGTSTTSTGEVAIDRGLFRALLPSALKCLVVGTSTEEKCYSALAPAAYIIEELGTQFKASVSAAKRSAIPFLRKASSTGPSVPSTAELLSVLRPLFPALKRHIDVALHVIAADPSEERLLKEEKRKMWPVLLAKMNAENSTQAGPLNSHIDDLVAVLFDNDVAARAVYAPRAARRVLLLSLALIEELLRYPDILSEEHRPTLLALVTAFMDKNKARDLQQQDGGEVNGNKVLLIGIKQMYLTLNCNLPRSGKNGSQQQQDGEEEDDGEEDVSALGGMDGWLATLKVQDALISVLQRVVDQGGDRNFAMKGFKVMQKMKKDVSGSAHQMLQCKWDNAGWKAAQVTEVLKLYLERADEPDDEVNSIIKNVLATAPPTRLPKDEVPDYPSYVSPTLATWYDAAWKQFKRCWKELTQTADSAAKSPTTLDEDNVLTIINQFKTWADVFLELITLVKTHNNQKIHHSALNHALPIFEDFARSDKFWLAVVGEHHEMYFELCKILDKTAGKVQTLCNEGKARQDDRLANLVPRVRKACEKFLYVLTNQAKQHGMNSAIEVGERKHRDVLGRVVLSQYFPAPEDDDEEEEAEQEQGGEMMEEDEQVGEDVGYDDDEEEEEGYDDDEEV